MELASSLADSIAAGLMSPSNGFSSSGSGLPIIEGLARVVIVPASLVFMIQILFMKCDLPSGESLTSNNDIIDIVLATNSITES